MEAHVLIEEQETLIKQTVSQKAKQTLQKQKQKTYFHGSKRNNQKALLKRMFPQRNKQLKEPNIFCIRRTNNLTRPMFFTESKQTLDKKHAVDLRTNET